MKIHEESFQQILIEKSRFLTYLFPIQSEEDFIKRYKELQSQYYDATHCCYAFLIEERSRHSDDGEPSGTAGLPILRALQQQEAENIACVVIRYFGGIKLGKGGLFRTYYQCAEEALKQAEFYEEYPLHAYQIILDYALAERFLRYAEIHAQKVEVNYGEQVHITFFLLPEDSLQDYLAITKGIAPIFLQEITAERKKKHV